MSELTPNIGRQVSSASETPAASQFTPTYGHNRCADPQPAARLNAWERIVRTASTIVRCNGAVLSLHTGGARPVVVAWSRLTQAAAECVASVSDPAAPDISRTGLQVIRSRVVNDRETTRGAANKAGDEGAHLLQMVIYCAAGIICLLSFVRFKSEEPFESSDITLVAQIAPLCEAIAETELQARQDRGWEVLDQMLFAVAVVDAKGQIEHANRAFYRLLDLRRDLVVKADRLSLTGETELVRLQQMLDTLDQSQPGAVLGFSTGSIPALHLTGVRLKPGRIALFVCDTSSSAPTSEAALRNLFGMTKVEAEVARLICEGLTPAEIADRLRMSIHTIRSYLKLIFQKMNARRQADIVRIVAKSSNFVEGWRDHPVQHACRSSQ